jgi:hypothetical protein
MQALQALAEWPASDDGESCRASAKWDIANCDLLLQRRHRQRPTPVSAPLPRISAAGVPDGAFIDVLLFSCHQPSAEEIPGTGCHRKPEKAHSHSLFQHWHQAHSPRFPRRQPLQPRSLSTMAIRSQVNCFS